jgi:hypothetical protein
MVNRRGETADILASLRAGGSQSGYDRRGKETPGSRISREISGVLSRVTFYGFIFRFIVLLDAQMA